MEAELLRLISHKNVAEEPPSTLVVTDSDKQVLAPRIRSFTIDDLVAAALHTLNLYHHLTSIV
jgi:hypothetical protein